MVWALLGITVSNDPDYLFLKDVYPQITRAVEAEMNVISTAEELAYPYSRHPGVLKKSIR